MVAAIFWISGALLTYTFVVYPLAICLLSRFGQKVLPRVDHWPHVSLLVPVYNEENVIGEKLKNCLELDYPPDRLEIVFASDGSTDRTVEILQTCIDPRVRILDYQKNRGKAAVLNETIPGLHGDIVLLTDASGILNKSALRTIVPLFHDHSVGCVCGMYHILKEGRTQVDSAESSYHGFEMQLRLWEGIVWTTLSGTGALTAVRRDEYEALPLGVINEDYIIPSRVALRGKRVIYAPDAHIFDRISTSLRDVYRRRVRIAYGNWQQVAHLRALLNPFRGYLSWVFYSHKILRMAMPFLVVLLFASSFWLSPWIYWSSLLGFCALLLLGIGGLVFDRFIKGHNPFGFIVLVYFNCVAVFIGTFKYFAGCKVKW
ncbi:MAG: glycosyltransferase family 2 protein [Bacteroidetes bacterium]|nr:glycosyltransferase family 2 protein [Bacteroidota bacterium]